MVWWRGNPGAGCSAAAIEAQMDVKSILGHLPSPNMSPLTTAAVEGWTNEAVEADMAYLLMVVTR